MIYTGYTQTDAYFEFTGSEGKLIMPATDVVLVDDESGMIAIKNTASRCTVGLLKIAPPAPSYKFTATYTGGTTYSAECDASTELTSATTKPEDYEFTAMTSAIIGDCVTSIGTYAFYQCTSLTSVTIPNSVTTVGDGFFGSCSSLSSIVIPSSVTSIGQYAFAFCSSLTSCTCLATTPPTLGTDAFINTNDCPIYVPSQSVGYYETESGWYIYASRIQAIQ